MLRTTPRNDKFKSANQRLFSRQTRTAIPLAKNQLKPQVVEKVSEELYRLPIEQKRNYDKVSLPTEQLKKQDKVREWRNR